MLLGGGAWRTKRSIPPRGGLPQPWRKSGIVLTAYPRASSPQTIAEEVMPVTAPGVPPVEPADPCTNRAAFVQAAISSCSMQVLVTQTAPGGRAAIVKATRPRGPGPPPAGDRSSIGLPVRRDGARGRRSTPPPLHATDQPTGCPQTHRLHTDPEVDDGQGRRWLSTPHASRSTRPAGSFHPPAALPRIMQQAEPALRTRGTSRRSSGCPIRPAHRSACGARGSARRIPRWSRG